VTHLSSEARLAANQRLSACLSNRFDGGGYGLAGIFFVQRKPFFVQRKPFFIQGKPFFVQGKPFFVQKKTIFVRKKPLAGLSRNGQTCRNQAGMASTGAGMGITRVFRHRHYRGFNQSSLGGGTKYQFSERYYYGII
jgi:hypothetical protein